MLVNDQGTPQTPHKPPKITCKQGFYITLPILHGLSAIAALVICFHCNVGQMKHQARTPQAPNLMDVGAPLNSSRVRLFLSAYHWAEDAEFSTHTWNPFALTMVFQWLTAGFALRTVAPLAPEGIVATVWYAWLGAGYTVFLVWSLVQTDAFCVAMFSTVTVCFAASGMVCYWALGPPRLCQINKKQQDKARNDENNYAAPLPHGDSRLSSANINGRLWKIPQSVKALKQSPSLQGDAAQEQQAALVKAFDDNEQVWGVFFRYVEYCITAPLLFLAVVCLLVVDAPAWLFLTGYWLVLACNLFGVPLHYNFLVLLHHHKDKSRSTGARQWLARLLLSNPWGSSDSGLWYNLEAAWIALLIPVSGLIYLSRGFLFDPDMPAIALFMIWNLLLTYTMFGIIPTVVYITGRGSKHLPWLLDILNIAAKFPLPIVIIVGFITRPVTFRPCIS